MTTCAYQGQNLYQCISSFINQLLNTDSFERTLGYRMKSRNEEGVGLYNHTTSVSDCCRFFEPIFTFFFFTNSIWTGVVNTSNAKYLNK